jgi:hypothetical protein
MSAWIDHRLQHGVVDDVVAQQARRRRGVGVGQVPSQSRVNDRRAVEQGPTDIVERDAPSHAIVFDDQTGAQSVVETLLDN